jgi:hypothetical protein
MGFDRPHPTPERVHPQLACGPYIPCSADTPRSSAPYRRDNRADCQHANHCEGDQGNAEEQKERQHGENTDNQEQHRAADRPQLRNMNASSRPNVGQCPDPRTDIHGSAGWNDFRLCPRLLGS